MKFWFVPLIFLSFLTNGQELDLELGRSISYYLEHENSIGSERVDNKSNHLLAGDMAQPITFTRTSGEFEPKPQVQYFFTKSDSVVQKIFYEWDKQNFFKSSYELTEKDIEDDMTLERFIEKYQDLKNELKSAFGESTSKGSLEPISNIDYLKVDARDDWKSDSISANIYMVFSNQFKVMGNMKITPTHRIRVTIQKAQKDVVGNISEHFKTVFKADEKQQSIAEQYVKYVIDKKYKKSWKLISPNLKEKIDFNTYELNISRIDELLKDQSDTIELLNSQPNIVGENVFYTYTLSFVNSNTDAPKVLLFVTFKAGEYFVEDFTPRKF